MNNNFENKDRHGREELNNKFVIKHFTKKFFKNLAEFIGVLLVSAAISIIVDFLITDALPTIRAMTILLIVILGFDPLFWMLFASLIMRNSELLKVKHGNFLVIDDVIIEKLMNENSDDGTPEFRFAYLGIQNCGEQYYTHIIGEHFYLLCERRKGKHGFKCLEMFPAREYFISTDLQNLLFCPEAKNINSSHVLNTNYQKKVISSETSFMNNNYRLVPGNGIRIVDDIIIDKCRYYHSLHESKYTYFELTGMYCGNQKINEEIYYGCRVQGHIYLLISYSGRILAICPEDLYYISPEIASIVEHPWRNITQDEYTYRLYNKLKGVYPICSGPSYVYHPQNR